MTIHPIPTNAAPEALIKIDLAPLIEHGDSPTAIILTLAVFSSVLLGAVGKLAGR
ncbi:MAG: hypothetical protein AAF289_09265 [Cyanobacteria bacterium P01_A01_bin.135]